MIYLWAFIVGGLICVVGQLMFDVAKLTPAHTMSTLVVAGAIADAVGIYDPLVKFAGAGASVPITSFGNSLVHGALIELEQDGWLGIVTGIFNITSAGISSAIVFSFLAALLVRPKG
ncbi:stage V sporulation protein AE [Paenibacillus sp. 7124]|uniref:Stage V sporulation protein AE n=1 Tax=Paenibacillus apii TaxID=1850370 RepID=A0A6M1PKQ1_9BACL|nr:stage V sporulation protein AE [Paenibacillus apii]NGM82855.1 stage V sporulation protein AE [Paenibacillus apii]NJJ39995.1 stage V sporulation protein AE [Paenibacillus apii]